MTTDQMQEMVFGCCGVVVWLPIDFVNDKKRSRETFYCPSGHGRSYRESTAEILQKKLDAANLEIQSQKERMAGVKMGVCPFCRRKFKNLSSHIERVH